MVAQAICRPAETAIGWHNCKMALEKRDTANHLAAFSGPYASLPTDKETRAEESRAMLFASTRLNNLLGTHNSLI